MSINGDYFAGMLAGILLLLGLHFIQRRQPTMGYGLWLGVLLLTILSGYMSFSM